MIEGEGFPVPKVPDKVVSHEIPLPDISSPDKLQSPSFSLVLRREVLYLHRTRPEREAFSLRRKRSQNKSEFMTSFSQDIHRSAFQVFLFSAVQACSYLTGNKVYFLVASVMVLLVSQVGFLCLDIINMKRYSLMSRMPLTRSIRASIRFHAIRAIKNSLIFFCCLIIMVQLGSDAVLSKWLLPIEIILVLYFVLIIYFIINTGEMVQYLKTMLFNMVIFIELFFAQKIIDGYYNSKEGRENFVSSLWVYPLFTVVYALLFFYFLLKGPFSFLVQGKVSDSVVAKGMRTISTQFLSALFSIVLSILFVVLIFHLPSRPVPGYLFLLPVISLCLMIVAFLTVKKAVTAIKVVLQAETEEIAKMEDKHEVKEDRIDIPYFVKRVAGGNHFKASDHFDLLRLAVLLQQDVHQQRSLKESLAKDRRENDSRYMRNFSMKSDPSGMYPERSSMKSRQDRLEIHRLPASCAFNNKFQSQVTGYAMILQENMKLATEKNSRHHSDESLRTDQVQLSQGYFSKGEESCFICCEQLSNSVAMPCGHGGLCLRCLFDLWTRGKGCYMCKAVVFPDEAIEYLLETERKAEYLNMYRVKTSIHFRKDAEPGK